MKSRLFGIILMLTLLWPIYFICHIVSQRASIRREIKHRIIAGMSRDELVPMKFQKDKYQSILIPGKNEFKWEGTMYDVVDLEQQGDSVIAWSWRDHRETALDKKMDMLISRVLGSSPQDKERRKQILSFFKLFYYSGSTSTQMFYSIQVNDYQPEKNVRYYSVMFEPPTPPPQLS